MREIELSRREAQPGEGPIGHPNLVVWDGPEKLILPPGEWTIRFKARVTATGASSVRAYMEVIDKGPDRLLASVVGEGPDGDSIESDFDVTTTLAVRIEATVLIRFRVVESKSGACVDTFKLEPNASVKATSPLGWREWEVLRFNDKPSPDLAGEPLPDRLAAQHLLLTDFISVNDDFEEPKLVYMSDKPNSKRLLLLFTRRVNGAGRTVVMRTSDDEGVTWSDVQPVRYRTSPSDTILKEVTNRSLALTYFGEGRLLFNNYGQIFASYDYGDSWEYVADPPPDSDEDVEEMWHPWFPYLLDNEDPTLPGRIWETGYFHSDGFRRVQTKDREKPRYCNPYLYAYAVLRCSDNGGKTWSSVTKVKEWKDVSEVCLFRVRGKLLMAACRMDVPKEYAGRWDTYEGLGTSFSRDNGKTWSKVTRLFGTGRSFPSFWLVENRLVMAYCVRLGGYPRDPDGFPQYGIEAMTCDLSDWIYREDAWPNWDFGNRFQIAKWSSKVRTGLVYAPSPRGQSTVMLSDQKTMLTAYSTGFRARVAEGSTDPINRDIALVRWPFTINPNPPDGILPEAGNSRTVSRGTVHTGVG